MLSDRSGFTQFSFSTGRVRRTLPLQLVMKTSIIYIAALMGLCANLRSELPPQVYEEMKRSASEVLVNNVSAVEATTDTKGREITFTYDASVIRSIRSKTGVKAGDKIVVRSRHPIFGPGEVGPSNPRKLKKGETVTAYLTRTRKEGVYTIAAGGHSFKKAEEGAIVAPPIVRVQVPPPAIIAEPAPPPPDFDPGMEEPGFFPPGMAMPAEMMMGEMGIPGRFQLISANVEQKGKAVPMVLKLDTMTGQVWHLKMKVRQVLVNGRPKMETKMVFEAIATEGPFFEEPGDFPENDEAEVFPVEPVPVPGPPRPIRRNLIEPAPRPRR